MSEDILSSETRGHWRSFRRQFDKHSMSIYQHNSNSLPSGPYVLPRHRRLTKNSTRHALFFCEMGLRSNWKATGYTSVMTLLHHWILFACPTLCLLYKILLTFLLLNFIKVDVWMIRRPLVYVQVSSSWCCNEIPVRNNLEGFIFSSEVQWFRSTMVTECGERTQGAYGRQESMERGSKWGQDRAPQGYTHIALLAEFCRLPLVLNLSID